MSARDAAARALLGEAINVAPADLPADAGLGSPPGWDSIGHMRLVLLLEERLGRMLTTEEIVGLATLSDVADLLDRRAGVP